MPEGRGTRPIAANVDQVFVVTAATHPDPIPQLIDRLLVVAEANDIAAAVVVNKVDLDRGHRDHRALSPGRLSGLPHQRGDAARASRSSWPPSPGGPRS